MLFFLVLFACNTGTYTITATDLDPESQSCRFSVEFPEDYRGPERGKQEIVVTAYMGPKANSQRAAYEYTLEGQTEGIGPELRRMCAGYLAEPEVPVAKK